MTRARPRRTRAGFSALWALVAVAMGGALVSGAALSSTPDAGVAGAATFGISSAIGALGLAVLARRDLFTVLAAFCVVDVLVAVVAWAIMLSSPAPSPALMTVVVVASAALLLVGAYLVRDQFFLPGPPDVLRARASGAPLFELEGVQFCLQSPAGATRPGGRCAFTVVAQNCWDAPRTLELALESRRGRAGLRFDPIVRLELEGAEVGRLEVPLLVDEAARRGGHALQVVPRVRGDGGVRVRRRRRREVPTRVPAWRTALGLVLGELVLGVGLVARVRVGPRGAPVTPSSIVPEARREIIWRP